LSIEDIFEFPRAKTGHVSAPLPDGANGVPDAANRSLPSLGITIALYVKYYLVLTQSPQGRMLVLLQSLRVVETLLLGRSIVYFQE
jgi:hypothetical protein